MGGYGSKSVGKPNKLLYPRVPASKGNKGKGRGGKWPKNLYRGESGSGGLVIEIAAMFGEERIVCNEKKSWERRGKKDPHENSNEAWGGAKDVPSHKILVNERRGGSGQEEKFGKKRCPELQLDFKSRH